MNARNRLPAVPADFPVAVLGPEDQAADKVTCGTCGRSWDDSIATSFTPAPSARCPFEAFHAEEDAMTDERVKVWADGFGRWHAEVSFPSPGYGPHHLDQHWSRIRAKARRAIRREILARENGPIKPVRIKVADNYLNSFNQMTRVDFIEADR